MRPALELAREAYARGDWPVGSLIVKQGAIVGRGRNEQVSRTDVTWHAETAAIRDAMARLGTLDLAGTTLYSTMEPCPMCAGAAFFARIDRMVVALRYATQRRTDLGAYSLEAFGTMMGWRVELVSGVREAEYSELRRRWGRDKVASG
jgi:tRNA(adenine34) deaminase